LHLKKRNYGVGTVASTDQASLDAVGLDGDEGALHLESQQRSVSELEKRGENKEIT
jgi:hypothetical protein